MEDIMKAKKFSFHAVLLCIAALFVTLLLLLSSCEESGAGSTGKPNHGKTHIHTFSAEWSSNDTHHWHAASCEHTNEVSDKAGHTFGDWITDQEATEETAGAKHHVCTVCGKTENAEIPKLPHTHKFSNDWSGDDIYHWHAASCEHTNIVTDIGKHVFGADDICNICGKAKPRDERTFAYTVENGQATLISYTPLGKISPTLIIPSTLGGYPVVRIGEGAFSNFKDIEGIVLPDSITSIGASAFSGCTGLTSIILPFIGATKNGTENTHFGYIFGADSYSKNAQYVPSTLKIVVISGGTRIGDSAFYGCKDITNIIIGNSIISIGNLAFYNCTSLTGITIGNGVTSIGGYAFNKCKSLTNITIPDSVTSIRFHAFDNCTNLQFNAYDNALYLGNAENPYLALVKANDLTITTCIISEKAKIICGSAFESCTGLTNITIPNGVIYIGNGAFRGCKGLTDITIPDSVTQISNDAFAICSGLTSIKIPNGVTSLESDVFNGCTGLTSITIPDSVTSIGSYAFVGCTGLTSITIPDSVTSIGINAFKGCTNLQFNTFDNALYLGNAENPYLALAKANDQAIISCVISEKVKIICGSAFENCTNLTSITIPDGTINICARAFSGCTGLVNITIPDGVSTIEFRAFYGCTNLTSIIIPDSVAHIDSFAFSGCSNLKSIYYTGTEAQWAKISKGSNIPNDITIVYNYKPTA